MVFEFQGISKWSASVSIWPGFARIRSGAAVQGFLRQEFLEGIHISFVASREWEFGIAPAKGAAALAVIDA